MKKNTNSKIILLTFDYELFLKESGTPENCILNPTNLLIEIFRKYNIKTTFFADILYYHKLINNNACKDISLKIKEQLQTLVSEGHRIELHLHPQWLDAEYINRQWIFKDMRNYRLDNLKEEKILELFDTGISLLHEICRGADSSYKIMAYRGGGLCLSPFETIKKAFIKHDIKIDSSAAPGFKSDTPFQKYDYSAMNPAEYYWFNDNPSQMLKQGAFLEIPVNSYNKTVTDKILHKFSTSLQDKHFGDGKGIPPVSHKNNLFSKLKSDKYMFSFDNNPDLIQDKIKKSNLQVINFISHTKLLSAASLKTIESICHNGFRFMNFKDFYESVSG